MGNWVVTAHRVDNDADLKRYEDLEQFLFSMAKDFQLEQLVEKDRQLDQFFPSQTLEEISMQYIEEYDNDTFWEDLIYRLAKRDFIREYGEETIAKMTMEERFNKENDFIEKYSREFEANGLEKVKID